MSTSLFLVVDKTLRTSDFGTQLVEHFAEEKDKLAGCQVCFSKVTHEKSLEWFKLDEVLCQFFYLVQGNDIFLYAPTVTCSDSDSE